MMHETHRLSSLLQNASAILEKTGCPTPLLDAEVLLAHLVGLQRFELHSRDVSSTDEQIKNFWSLCERRASREPVAYITGVKEFWSIPIKVTNQVLIPRPETELIVEETIKRISDRTSDLNILDIGSGSGCISAALASELNNCHLTLMDISSKALEVSRKNLSNALDRTDFIELDVFSNISFSRKFDFIVSNPPYIPDGDRECLSPEIKRYEPSMALFSGKDGLDFIGRLLEIAPRHLNDGGFLIFEIGFGQASKVNEIASANDGWKNVEIKKDLAGIDRSVALQWKN